MPRLPLLLVLALGLAPVAGACGSSAVGVTACKSIEEARCRQLPSCPDIQISPPLWYTTGSPVDACVRYYDTACLHGLAIGSDPGNADVNNCVGAIKASCDIVAAPQASPQCSWLIPPSEEDAGTVDVVDAADAADSPD